jgi:hypothetical protein
LAAVMLVYLCLWIPVRVLSMSVAAAKVVLHQQWNRKPSALFGFLPLSVQLNSPYSFPCHFT